MCNSVLQGDQYTWLRLYNLSEWRTAPITAARQENPVYLGNTVLQDLPGTSGLRVPPTKSCGEAMGDFIVSLVASAYDL